MKIIFSHCTQSYPIKYSASNTKADFLARGLYLSGASITFINSILGSEVENNRCLIHNNFRCYLFSKKKNILLRFIINLFTLIKVLQREYKHNDINILFIGGIFPINITQMIFAKIIGYKLAYLTQEWNVALNHKRFIHKLDSIISTKFYGRCVDMIFPISHFLWEKNKVFNKPMHIIPILSDFNTVKENNYDNFHHFCYCASAEYYETLKLIIDAYTLFIENGGEEKLILILYGNTESLSKAKQLIKSSIHNEMIEIKEQISNDELEHIYQTSLGLLIPLKPNNVQDIARFSQKIAEYLASKRPIITCNVGEIPYYFNNKNVLISDYTAKSFSDSMIFLATHKKRSIEIGENGYKIGKKYFDYTTNGKEVFNFIKTNNI